MESAEELGESRLSVSASRWSPSIGRQDNGSRKDPGGGGDGSGENKLPGGGRFSPGGGRFSPGGGRFSPSGRNSVGESFYTSEGIFSNQSSVSSVQRHEEALQWDALQRLSTYDHLKTSVLRYIGDDGKIRTEEKDVTTLSLRDRQQIIDQILHVVEESNELFLRKLRARLNRVGINLPTIEIRYNHLSIEAQVHLGSRVTPNVLNYLKSIIEWPLSLFGAVKKSRIQIISDLSGVVKPKRLTLLLGPPQSGRTTFLRALAGRLDRNLQVSGDISYNGHQMNEFVAQKTSSYVSQYDVQTPELTVRESLDFYCRAQGVGNRRDMLNELLRREREAGIKPEPDTDIFLKATTLTGRTDNLLTDYFMKLTGLDICADTMIGDVMHRGISGGQKKRLTTAEMLVGPAKALLMDEISTGLDSSTTFQVALMLRHIAHLLESTIVVSLLQPPPETYELFDDLILLAEGQIVYQGPCSSVVEFMEFMGFKCPPRKAVADFLQEVTSRKDQQQYWADASIPYQYVSVPKFVKGFSLFHVGQSLANEVSIPYDKSKSHPAALIHKKYSLNNKQILQACFARELILMKRHLPVYTSKVVQMGIVSAIAGTLFLRTRMPRDTVNDANLYIGALFFGLILVMTAGLAELSFTLVRLPVYYKEKELSLYPAWAIVIPMFILRIPWSVMETAVYMFICYFTTGFAPEAGRFVVLFLTLFLINQATVGVFRFAAAVGRTRVAAMNVGTAINVTVILLGGFVISKESTPVWWKWASWCSTLMYGQLAVSANELLSDQWKKPFGDSTLGISALKLRGLESKSFIIWTSIAALLGFTIVFNVALILSLEYLATPPVARNNTALKRDDEEEESTEESDLTSHKNPSESPARNDRLGVSQTDFQSPRRSPRRSSGFARNSSASDRPSRMSSGTYARLDLFGGKRGMVLPFKPYAISFDKISYDVDMPKTMKQHGVDGDRLRLLTDISGAFRPGVMTALVGVSGAGKTTLLDVLAGRKTRGYVEGEIMISGYLKQQATFARIAGYCEQTDIHSPNITVYESVLFSAWMRLAPEVDRELRQCFVDEVIRLVELEDLRDFVVGLPGESGLTLEQRKRLTIAVELVANPSIIFMDEPTSGLDARAAAIVMRAVRNIGDTGRTIVCTIHQPSIDIFEAFDELLLLKRGGKTIYSGRLGRHSRYLIEYFEAIPGVPKIKNGYNPATWMLDVSSTSMETKLGIDFAKVYENSSAFRNNRDLVERLKIPNPESTDLTFPTKYAQSFGVQCMASFWKVGMSYWRNTSYTGVRILYTIAFALLIGSVFWGLGKKRKNQQDIFNIMGASFTAVLFMGANGTLVVQPVTTIERIVYYRERGAQMYSPMAFTSAQFFIEWPNILLQSAIFTAITYSMMELEWKAEKVFFFYFFLSFALLFYIYWGMIAVAATANPQLAAILSTSFFGLFNLFAGLAITKAQIPIWWKWVYWCNPPAWTLYGLIASQLGDVDQLIVVPDQLDQQVTVKQFVADYFGFERSFVKWVALEHVGLVLSMALIFAVLIKYCNFQRR